MADRASKKTRRRWSTAQKQALLQQTQQAVADGVIEVIEAFAAGRVENCVNLARRPRGRCSLVIRHKDQVGVLASVLTCLRERDINVQQMQNQVFDGDGPTAAVATIRVSRPVDADTVASLHAIDAVYAVRVQSEDN